MSMITPGCDHKNFCSHFHHFMPGRHCAHPRPAPGVTWSQCHSVIFLDFNTSTKSWCRNSFNIPSPPISWPFSLGQSNVRFSSQKCFIVKYEMSSSLSKTCHMILKFAFKYYFLFPVAADGLITKFLS